MEKAEINSKKCDIIRKALIAAFCIVIVASVAFVLFGVYNPNQNNLGALSSVTMDVICIVILIVLICSFVFGNYGYNTTSRLFSALLLSTIWALFLDFMNWALDGMLQWGNVTFWFTAGSLCMGSILACFFTLYIYSYMKETHMLSVMCIHARVCAISNIVSFVITFILAITKAAFTFVDGHYETGVLYYMVTVIPVLTLLYMTGFVVCCVKKVGVHDVLSVAGYILFMVAGALIETQYSIGTTYVCVAIADLFIFVMLQNEIITQEKRNVQEWMLKSNTDELTGFFNRNAYETDIKLIGAEAIPEDLVYVSVDVNALKSVNDSFGHNAGDELLVGAARCLKKSLGPYGKLYRTGGDEFIGLIYANDEQLAKIKSDFEKLTSTWRGKSGNNLTISYGYATRREAKKMSIKQMAVLADKRMYEDKEAYYRRTGIDRRKK